MLIKWGDGKWATVTEREELIIQLFHGKIAETVKIVSLLGRNSYWKS